MPKDDQNKFKSTRNLNRKLQGYLTILLIITISLGFYTYMTHLMDEDSILFKYEREDLKNFTQALQAPSKLGETVSLSNGTEWTLLEVKDLGPIIPVHDGHWEDCVSNGGKYIYLKLKVKNLGSMRITLDPINIYDSLDREFTEEVYLKCIDQNFDEKAVESGLENVFEFYFEVPEKSSNFNLIVGAINFKHPKIVKAISLGF